MRSTTPREVQSPALQQFSTFLKIAKPLYATVAVASGILCPFCGGSFARRLVEVRHAQLAEFLFCGTCDAEYGPFAEDESASDLFWARPTSQVSVAELIQKRTRREANA